MLHLRMRWLCALAPILVALLGSTAAAQERLDSSARVWGDFDVYSGDLLVPGAKITSLTPVLRGELELSSLQLGLDLPLAIGASSFDSELLPGNAGFGLRLGNPTLHVDYLLEVGALRVTAGAALAISTQKNLDASDDSAVAASAAATAGMFARGLWNAWWYFTNAWGLVVPVSVESSTSEYEAGADAALAWFILRDSSKDNEGMFQLGGHVAAVLAPALVGLRLTGVVMLDQRFLGDDQLQISIEPYAELRLPIAWFGLGINLPLDEPLGIFGDADFWAVRVSGGASF